MVNGNGNGVVEERLAVKVVFVEDYTQVRVIVSYTSGDGHDDRHCD